MTVVEDGSPEMVCFQEIQNTPVSSAVIISFNVILVIIIDKCFFLEL